MKHEEAKITTPSVACANPGIAGLMAVTMALATPLAHAASSSAESSNIRVDTRGRNLVSLTVEPAVQPGPPAPDGPEEGPPAPGITVPAGGTLQFLATAFYDDGSSEDVTSHVRWGLGTGAPARSTVSSTGLFTVGSGQYSFTFDILAWFSAGKHQRTASFTTRVIPKGLAVAIEVPPPQLAGAWWQLEATAVVYRDGAPLAPAEAALLSWDFGDDDGFFDNGTGRTFSTTLVEKRSYLIRVRAIHNGETATAAAMFSVDAQAVNQPVVQNLVDVFSQMLVKPSGEILAELPVTTKLAVVIHGLENSATTDWVAPLCSAIQAKIPGATVVAYDWEQMADPSLYARNRTAKPGDGDYVEGLDIWEDVQLIREYGVVNGIMLAERLLRERDLGHIGDDTPIHLIGHSAGGFVAGECASRLSSAKFTNLQATMLDTPAPLHQHLNKAGWYSERYNSSWLAGRFKPGSRVEALWTAAKAYNLVVPNKIERVRVSAVTADSGSNAISTPSLLEYDYDYAFGEVGTVGPRYYRRDIIHKDLPDGTFDRHGFAHEWYGLTVPGPVSGKDEGFFYTNLKEPKVPFPASPAAAPVPRGPDPAPDGPEEIPPPPVDLDGFTYFGTASGSAGVHTLTEGTDAGFFKTFTLPIGSETLRFRYRFTTPGDGDFIAAYWGEEEVLVIGPDTASARAGFVEMEADVSRHGGREGTITFKLTSRNAVNAVVEIDQVQIVLSEDPDGDGLTNPEELALGSDAHLFDTDGDGLSDYDEANVHGTSPLRADSDGDTVPDPVELALGTDPTDRASVLRPRMERSAGGQLELRWQGVSGRSYSVVRSFDLSGTSFDFIATGVAGGATECVVIDPDTTANPRAFYWLLQEP